VLGVTYAPRAGTEKTKPFSRMAAGSAQPPFGKREAAWAALFCSSCDLCHGGAGALRLIRKAEQGWTPGGSEMSHHQGDRIKLRAHWLAIEFVFYLLGLLALGAQLASLVISSHAT
jgi:hypothetical protein